VPELPFLLPPVTRIPSVTPFSLFVSCPSNLSTTNLEDFNTTPMPVLLREASTTLNPELMKMIEPMPVSGDGDLKSNLCKIERGHG
jgi:hypothetical protein